MTEQHETPETGIGQALKKATAKESLKAEVKALTEDNDHLKHEVRSLQNLLQDALEEIKAKQAIVRQLSQHCPTCKEQLYFTPWNVERVMLLCNNSTCKNFRKPAGGISVKELNEARGKAPQPVSEGKLPPLSKIMAKGA